VTTRGTEAPSVPIYTGWTCSSLFRDILITYHHGRPRYRCITTHGRDRTTARTRAWTREGDGGVYTQRMDMYSLFRDIPNTYQLTRTRSTCSNTHGRGRTPAQTRGWTRGTEAPSEPTHEGGHDQSYFETYWSRTTMYGHVSVVSQHMEGTELIGRTRGWTRWGQRCCLLVYWLGHIAC
jgi:hypothetical protein